MTASITRYVWLMLIRGSTLVLKFGLSFYLARYLNLDALGVFGLLVGASLVVPTLVRAGLTSTLTRTLLDVPTQHMVTDIQHYLVWVGACYGVLIVLSLPVSWSSRALALPFPLYLVWLVIMAEHLAADLALLFTNLSQADTANAMGLVQTAVWVLPFCAISYVEPAYRSVEVLLWFWASGTCLTLLVFSRPIRQWPWKARQPLKARWFITHLTESRYLYLSDLTSAAAQFVDRFLIAMLIDIEHAGVYTLFFQLANAVYTLVSSSVVNQHRPLVLAAFTHRDVRAATHTLRTMQKQALGAVVCMSIAMGVAFQYLAPLLNRQMVLEYMPLMWVIYATMVIKTWCHTEFLGLFAKQRDRFLFGLNLMVLSLVVWGGVATIPFAGIYGIPLATSAAFAVALLLIGLAQHPPTHPAKT